MPFPQAARVVFDHNPLDLVVTQLKFPPILSIAAEQPADFQNRIRGDYPLYARQNTVVVPEELAQLLAKLGGPPQAVRHTFRPAEGTLTVSLTSDFLACEEKHYQRWEVFVEQLSRVFRALVEVYQPPFFTRLGLRYMNVIRRSALDLPANTPWADLVTPTFIGLLGLPEYRDRTKESISVHAIRLDDVPGGVVRIQHGLRPTEGEEAGEETYFIDADFFTEERTNVTDAIDRLGAFHGHSGNLFRWVITDRLYNALRPQPVAAGAARAVG